MKKILLLLTLIWMYGQYIPVTLAQLDQALRLEIVPHKEEDRIYDVTSLGDKGVLVSTQPRYSAYGNENYWSITRYDTTFGQQWERRFELERGFEPTRTDLDSNYLYVLLSLPESTKIKVFRLDYNTGEGEFIEGSTLAYVNVSEFKVLGNTAYIGGAVNFRPVVIAFSFFDKRSRVLPALYESRSELSGIGIDSYQNVANIVVSNIGRRQSRLYLKSFDYSGKILKNIQLQSQKDKNLQTGKVTHLNEEEQVVLGNFSFKNSPYSQGIYMVKLDGDQQSFIKYYNFNDFENFFSFMKPRRQERVKMRILHLRERGKELQHRYRLLLHDIIETKDQYILVAEAYYPQYRSSSFYGYSSLNRGYDRVFDGYRYTHAVVCGFDKSGKLLWDNCFQIMDHTSYYLSEIVKVAVEDDKIVLAYPEEGTINTKVIRGNHVLKDKENYKIKTNFEGDKVTDSEDASIDHWYGPYFITWGFQEIYNSKDAGVKPNRKVFYLNKINYRSDAASLLPEQKTETEGNKR